MNLNFHTKILIIALPPNSKPTFTLKKGKIEKVQSAIPAVNPKLKILPDSSVALEEMEYSTNQLEAQQRRKDIEVVGYFWYRDFYCAYLRINNYSYNEVNNSIEWFDDFSLNILFNRSYNFTDNSPIKINPTLIGN